MDQFFADGRMIDIVVAVLLLEVTLLAFVTRRHRLLLPSLLPNLLAGLMLLLAWRFTQAGLPWTWIATALSAAGAAHGWDLWRRWPVASAR